MMHTSYSLSFRSKKSSAEYINSRMFGGRLRDVPAFVEPGGMNVAGLMKLCGLQVFPSWFLVVCLNLTSSERSSECRQLHA
jgi:hypothetical protein